MSKKNFVAIGLAVGLLLLVGCAISQRPMRQVEDQGMQQVEVPSNVLVGSGEVMSRADSSAPDYSPPSYLPPSYQSFSHLNYSPPSYNLTGRWTVWTWRCEDLVLTQSGNMVVGTMVGCNETTTSDKPPDHIAGTISPVGEVEFNRTHLNEWPYHYIGIVSDNSMVSGVPGSLYIEGTYADTNPMYPTEYPWTAYFYP